MSSTSPPSPEPGPAGLDFGETDPFPIDGPDGFFFSTPALEQRLDLLHHLVQYSDLLLIIEGPPGCGKSTLLEELLARAGERWHGCRIRVAADLGPEALVAQLVEGLRLDTTVRAGADPMETLETHLEALHRSSQIAVIAIDDADLLPEETAGFVTDLGGRWEGFKTRIVLTRRGARGEEESRGADEFTHVIDVPPLGEDEVQRYLLARLERAGMSTGRADGRMARALHRASGGNPAALHAHAGDLVDSHPARATARGVGIAARTPMRAAVVGGVVLALAGLGFGVARWLEAPGTPAARPDETGALAAAEPAQPTIRDRVPGPPEPATTQVVPPVAAVEAGPPSPPPEPEPDQRLEPERPAAEPVLPEPEPEPEPIPAVASAAAADNPAPGAPAHAPPASKPPAPEQDPTRAPAPAPEPAAPEIPPPEPAGASTTTDGPAAPEPTVPALETTEAPAPEPPVPEAQPVAPKVPGRPPTLRNAAWLLSQSDDQWVIQLLGSHDAGDVRRFAARHGIAGRSATFTTVHQGKPWHVLVHGLYPSREAAIAAAGKLPAALRRASPWTRTIASLRKAPAP